MENGSKKEKKKMKTGVKVLLIVLGVLLVLLIAAAVIVGRFYQEIQDPAALFGGETGAPAEIDVTPEPTKSPVQTAEALPEATPSPTPTPDPLSILTPLADMDFMKNRVNVLALGIDESAERESWGSYRTDTMILITIDFNTNAVDLISVPRDSYVKIYTANANLANETDPYEKINSAFSAGGGAKKKGFEYAMQTVSKLLGGIPIDYYVGFNMPVVKQLVDAMGGVYYDVDIDVMMNGRHTEKGYQLLTGQQVLDYCRVRKIDSDIKRVDRQQRMLQAILDQLKSSGQIANIPAVYQALEQNIQTNLTFKQISSLALLGLNMRMDQLGRHTVEGQGLTFNQRSYWCVSVPKLQRLLQEVFGVENLTLDAEMDAEAIQLRLAELDAFSTAAPTDDGSLVVDSGDVWDFG